LVSPLWLWQLFDLKSTSQIIAISGIAIALSPLLLSCSQKVDGFSSHCIELIDKRAYQEALNNCDQAILLGSNSATDYVRRGFVYTQLGKYKEAIEDYNQALLLQPDALIIYNHRCVTYFRAGKYQKAIEDCEQVLHENPNLAGGYANRGRARAALKDYQGAIKDYQIAAKLFLKQGNQEGYQAVLKDLGKLKFNP
jgi:tetratricopeptide (TPR) repeat protein